MRILEEIRKYCCCDYKVNDKLMDIENQRKLMDLFIWKV